MTDIMTNPMPVIDSLLAGLPILLLHLGGATAVWLGALMLYLWITPHQELALVRGGNSAAALSMGGAAIGLALPMAFTLAGSINFWDIVIWGGVTLALQLIAFRGVDYLLKDLPKRIEAGEMSAAIFLATMKLALASLNAGAIAT
jgi:putative membrane protein